MNKFLEAFFESPVEFLLATALALALGLGTTAIVMSARASGAIDYCRIEYISAQDQAPTTRLLGHRVWRADSVIGVFSGIDTAQAAAAKIGCPLNHE